MFSSLPIQDSSAEALAKEDLTPASLNRLLPIGTQWDNIV